MDGKVVSTKEVYIPKGKIEKCPRAIFTIQDKIKQALVKLALEPEWEAKFEPNSYGFRPGRFHHDAVEAIFIAINHNCFKDYDFNKYCKKGVLVIDVWNCMETYKFMFKI